MTSHDPTRTKTRRERWVGNLNRRWRRVRGAVRSEIQDGDRFRISPLTPDNWDNSEVRFALENWIRRKIDEEVIETTRRRSVASGRHWTASNVRDAYEAGLKRADYHLRNSEKYTVPDVSPEAAITREKHRRELGRSYTAVYQDLQAVANASVTEVLREIDEALQGRRPSRRQIAESINDRIDAVGQTRSEAVSHTRTVEAANNAALNRYESAGVEEVGVDPEVEFTTAGDERVCPLCRGLEGNRYSLEEAVGVIPGETHPRCRCLFVPV